MATNLLVDLAKAGGIAALAFGVLYLLYREVLKLRIFPKLKQSQAFTLICLVVILVFTLAMTALVRTSGQHEAVADGGPPATPVVATARVSPPTGTASNVRDLTPAPRHEALARPATSLAAHSVPVMPGALPASMHFQLDSVAGVFCESQNVGAPSFSYFDYLDLNIGSCSGAKEHASRAYRILWTARESKSIQSEQRRNYLHCFNSDLADIAPDYLRDLSNAFERQKDKIPCRVAMYIARVITGNYVDLDNTSRNVAFVQFYNRGGTGKFEIEQIPSTNLPQSQAMNEIPAVRAVGVPDDALLKIARQFSGVPRE